MFQQNGHRENCADAKFKEHHSSKSVQELKAELDAIFEKEEGTGVKADPELIAEYVAAIENMDTDKRSQAQSHDDFEKSWAQFTKNHPDLFPTEETKPEHTSRKRRHLGRYVEAAILAATILVVTTTAFNLPDHVVLWGKELFGIAPAPSGVMELIEPNADGYSTMKEAVAGAGLDEADTPTWIPTQSSIQDIAIQELISHTTVTGVYVAGEKEFAIRIAQYVDVSDMPDFAFEKNDDDKQEDVTQDGITYHYTENYDVCRVTWKKGKCLYSILGEVSRDEMERMVNSFNGG